MELFEDNPKMKSIFDGFTFYTENMSEYPQTFPSVISMLTGEYFTESGTRSEFSSRAWENATLFDELHTRDYTVNALLAANGVYCDVE